MSEDKNTWGTSLKEHSFREKGLSWTGLVESEEMIGSPEEGGYHH